MNKKDFDKIFERLNLDELRWKEELARRKAIEPKVPINLILDTNWWIYLAKGEHPEVLLEIIDKLNNNEYQLITCQVIIDEWTRRLVITRDEANKFVLEQSRKAYEIAEYLNGDEKANFKEILNKYKNIEKERLLVVNQNIDTIDEIVKSKSIIAPISIETKDLTLKFGIEKKAPFGKKNSTADALIFFSCLQYLKDTNQTAKGNSIFISYNSDDFSRSKNEKDIIHDDLSDFLNETNTTFVRNIGEAMKLAKDIASKIERDIDIQIENRMEDDYIEELIDRHIQDEIEIERGK